MKRYRISIFLNILLIVVSINLCQAQDLGDPSANDPAVPIDGGIICCWRRGRRIRGGGFTARK